MRSALADFWVAHGRPPTGDDLAGALWGGPHPATLRRRYGGADAAWGELGPAPPAVPGRLDPAPPAPPGQ